MKNKSLNILTLFLLLLVCIITTGCGHTHSYATQTIAPTVTTNGYTRHSCSCGEYYDDNYTCLLTFESTCTDPNVALSALPQISAKIVAYNSIFEKIDDTNDFKIANYTSIQVGQTITNSQTITIVWQARTQTEKDCLALIDRIGKLCEISSNYNSQNVLLRATQYLRTAKYTTTAWNIVGGTLDENFIDYVAQNQGATNIVGLRQTETLTSPTTNEQLDFIHMFGVINGIENTQAVNSGSADLAGWAGDLCTLVQEIVNANVSGDEITALANQKFNSLNSTFGNLDLIADLDAVNIMQLYYQNSSQTDDYACFIASLKNYYLNTTINLRKTTFMQNVFNKTYTSAKQMVADIMARLQNNFLITYFCQTLGIDLTTHNEQFIACATAFANYFFEN